MQVIAKNTILALVVTLFVTGCISPGVSLVHETSGTEWKLVYANDENGNTLRGSKKGLIAAIRAGKPVRIYTAGNRIEHATEAQFLSIFKGEVFAQTAPIESQRPTENPTQIVFRQPGEKWRSIVGTNGFVTAFMDGKEPNVRQGSTKWFVQEAGVF